MANPIATDDVRIKLIPGVLSGNKATASATNLTTAVDTIQHNLLELFAAIHHLRVQYGVITPLQSRNRFWHRSNKLNTVKFETPSYIYQLDYIGPIDWNSGGGISVAGVYESFRLVVKAKTAGGDPSTVKMAYLIPFVGVDPLDTRAVPAAAITF